jgi:hypothetical protein
MTEAREMKRFLCAAALLAFAAVSAPAFAGGRTVVGTITAIDPEERTFSVTDGVGVRWNYKALSDADIDLKGFRTGDHVTVSIGRATPPNMMSAADYFRKGDTLVRNATPSY